MNSGSFLLGPVIGAALYAAFPMSIVLMSDVIGALLASLALAAVKIPKLEKAAVENESMRRQFQQGLEVFKADRKLFYVVIAETCRDSVHGVLYALVLLLSADDQ